MTRSLALLPASAAALLTLLFISPPTAFAHAFAPAILDIQKWPDGRVDLVFRIPGAGGDSASLSPAMAALKPILSPPCRLRSPAQPIQEPRATIVHFSFDCAGSPEHPIRLEIEGLRRVEATVVVRFTSQNPQPSVILLHGAHDSLVFPPTPPNPIKNAASAPFFDTSSIQHHIELGLDHIARGLDHILFVLCLVLFGHKPKRIAWAITAFSLAHSLTLGLSVFGLLRLPPKPIEALIALSVVFLATEAARASKSHNTPNLNPGNAAIFGRAFAFGLLHGLGFASALSNLGLAKHNLARALLGFNLGVELGQLAFVLLSLLFLFATDQILRTHPSWSRRTLAHAAGITGVLLFLERIFD